MLDDAEIREESEQLRRDFQEKEKADELDWLDLQQERKDELEQSRSGLEGEALAARIAADESALAQLTAHFEQQQAIRRKRFNAEVAARELRLLSERAEAVRHAQKFRFRLARPTYGQHEAILAQSEQADPVTGLKGIDERLYRQNLLKANPKTVFLEGKDLTPEQIDDLDPAVGATLGTLMTRSLAVDRARLVFTSSASEVASTVA